MDDQKENDQKPRFYLLRKTAKLTVFLIVLLGACLWGWLSRYSNTPGPAGPSQVVVSIPRGSSVEKIKDILATAGVIYGDIRFSYLARLNGVATKLRAGEFSLRTGRLPLEVMNDLVKAVPFLHNVTIAEGLKATEIAEIFAKGNWCSTQEFLELIHDSNFISTLGFEKFESLEGYLYPDTYSLTRIPEISTKNLIAMMVRRFHQVWTNLEGDAEQMHNTVILASIVEKETADPSERPRIASVFHNRLVKGMRLQSDPTVIYGLKNFNGNLTRQNLRTHTPYNTYVIPSLPFGPICNPGKEALASVLRPIKEQYLYFVSKNDGSHYFSKSLSEHNRAVYKYQKRKSKR